MSDVSNPLDQSGAAVAAEPAAKPVVASPAAAPAKAEQAPAKAVAEDPGKAEKKPKSKPKPMGVTVHERAVYVDGKLVPMAERHQTPLAGGQKPEPVAAAAPAS